VGPRQALILACGGASYPSTGSRGDGYPLAAALGHRLVIPRPSLVGLLCRENMKGLADLTLRNVRLWINDGATQVFDGFGELELTDYGIWGPIVLDASRVAVPLLATGRTLQAHLDLKAALPPDKLEIRFNRDLAEAPQDTTVAMLGGLLARPLIPWFVTRGALDGRRRVCDLTPAMRQKILLLLKDLPLTLTGYRPIEEAIVTQGGVALEQVDPATLRSKVLPNVYFAGELLDLDGPTGGFNLQIAFSTGYLAGKSAAAHI
jgi:predicted Rossmann fold flavoprotein